LSQRGWEALTQHGVRTVVDLRNDDERQDGDAGPGRERVTTVHVPLDVNEDREFWSVWQSGPQFGTPLYYRPHLDRFPERNAAVIAAIADAQPGGVAFHCVGGRDRAGQVTLLLLAFAGVPADVIASDYALSYERLPARYAARNEHDQGPQLRSFLEERGTTPEALIVEVLAALDVEAYLRKAGLAEEQLARLHDRLLEEPPETQPRP
jgi:hypothetical protein